MSSTRRAVRTVRSGSPEPPLSPAAEATAAREASSDEVTFLIERLLETSHRLEDLTGGEIDSVADGVGRTTLLPGALAELRRSAAQTEGRYRGLLEAAPDAMVVVNGAGEILLLNARAEKQFGYSRDELVGQPATKIIAMPDGFVDRISDKGALSGAQALARLAGVGLELVGRGQDGNEFPIEITLSAVEAPDGAGVTSVTLAIRDISVRKAAEARVEQMEARYRGLLEAAPDAMVVVDQVGTIVLLNVQAEKQFGYSRDELVGQPVTNIIPVGFAERLIADDLRSAEDALAQVIGTGIELLARRKDGSEFPIEIMLSPLASAEHPHHCRNPRHHGAEGTVARCGAFGHPRLPHGTPEPRPAAGPDQPGNRLRSTALPAGGRPVPRP
jgi:PAS domain S-box-containing protein